MVYKFEVKELKTRLDKFLVGALPEFSRAKVQQDIASGQVRVNEQIVLQAKFQVCPGDLVTFTPSEKVDKNLPKDLPVKVLFENDDLLILDKPAGISVHPGAGFKGDSLTQMLLFRYPSIQGVGEAHRPGIVHRLDKETSGCLLVAKTSAMYDYLKTEFASRKVQKSYIALVYGHLEKPITISTPIGKSARDFRKMTAKSPKEAKAALTEALPLEYLHISPKKIKGRLVDEVTLILVKLYTGRTHQIRVHMETEGFPLVGDELYGGKNAQLDPLQRHFLHAHSLEVQLPDQSWVRVESPLPSDLRALLQDLKSQKVNQL